MDRDHLLRGPKRSHLRSLIWLEVRAKPFLLLAAVGDRRVGDVGKKSKCVSADYDGEYIKVVCGLPPS